MFNATNSGACAGRFIMLILNQNAIEELKWLNIFIFWWIYEQSVYCQFAINKQTDLQRV